MARHAIPSCAAHNWQRLSTHQTLIWRDAPSTLARRAVDRATTRPFSSQRRNAPSSPARRAVNRKPAQELQN
ncbi:hypothetical protein A2U01_0093842 [Trifolium medium]|uniref:Uncharacterized protein n=1 Tax=Trifolium medium TaxID=97028 RepID=A0A392UG94_9FABA|nr:hypothetical protein [Trifolium medium]